MDLIDRQEPINALKVIKIRLWEIDIPHPGNCPEYIEHHKQIQEMMRIVGNFIERIEALPTAETEIIRCKDCKHSSYCYSEVHMLDKMRSTSICKDISFCSFAERRTDG